MFRILPHRALIEPRASVARIAAGHGESTATLRVDGLLCSACAANVQQALERVEGVWEASVDLDRGEALVRYDASRTAPEALVRAVEGAVVLRPLRKLLGRIGHRFTQMDPDSRRPRAPTA